MEYGKEANYEFYIGETHHPEVLETSGFSIPSKVYDDTSRIKSIRVVCYQIGVKGSQLKAQGGSYNCLDWKEYQELVLMNWVDTSRLIIYDRALEPEEIIHFKQLAKEENWPPM